MPNVMDLVTTTVLHMKIREVESKILDSAKYITAEEFNKLTVFRKLFCKIKGS